MRILIIRAQQIFNDIFDFRLAGYYYQFGDMLLKYHEENA
jgi:hypothetical protein